MPALGCRIAYDLDAVELVTVNGSARAARRARLVRANPNSNPGQICDLSGLASRGPTLFPYIDGTARMYCCDLTFLANVGTTTSRFFRL